VLLMMPTGSARLARDLLSKTLAGVLGPLGIGQRMVDKGVVWSVGKIFTARRQLYQFICWAEEGHRRPAFINLQQFYARPIWSIAYRSLPESTCAGATR